MKSKKVFFEKSFLNRGHAKKSVESSASYKNIVYDSKRFNNILPPIEILAQYEELSPGSIDRLFELTKKEQEHKHSIEIERIEIKKKMVQFGKFSFIMITLLLCISVFALSVVYDARTAFAVGGVAAILFVFIMYVGMITCKRKLRYKRYAVRRANSL